MRMNCFARNAVLLIAAAGISVVAQQSTGYIKTSVNPGRAGVFVDGKYMGPAANFRVSRKYAVAPGEHEVKLLDPRYEDIVTKVTVQAGKTVKISETMKPLPPAKPPFGQLHAVTADKFDAVYVNDRFMGHAGEFNNSHQSLELNPGEYTVKIVPVAGGAPHEEHVKIEADKVTIVKATK